MNLLLKLGFYHTLGFRRNCFSVLVMDGLSRICDAQVFFTCIAVAIIDLRCDKKRWLGSQAMPFISETEGNRMVLWVLRDQ